MMIMDLGWPGYNLHQKMQSESCSTRAMTYTARSEIPGIAYPWAGEKPMNIYILGRRDLSLGQIDTIPGTK